MIENEVNTWLYTLFVCGCFTSVILYITPNGKNRSVVEVGCSCVMILALILPFRYFNLGKYYDNLTEYTKQLNEEIVLKQASVNQLYKEIIEQEYAEYIFNEAESKNILLESVSVKAIPNDDENYVPYSVLYLTNGTIPDDFLKHIEMNFGVSQERQRVYEDTGKYQEALGE